MKPTEGPSETWTISILSLIQMTSSLAWPDSTLTERKSLGNCHRAICFLTPTVLPVGDKWVTMYV